MSGRMRKDDHTAETRTALLDVARRLFARHGYANTSVAEIARAARVTTGALYHQFSDKEGIFKAVAEIVEQEIMEKVIAAAARAGGDGRARILAGIEGMLTAVMSPDVYRIAFIEAATVIGPQAWREIEMRYAFGLLHGALSEVERSGKLRGLSAAVVAPMILGALHEAAVTIAGAKDKDGARVTALKTMSRMLDGLLATDS